MMTSDVPVAILAGGLATRLRPVTATIPKSMVEVNGRPFIDHQLELLRRHGVSRVTLCVGHLGEQIEAHLGNGERFGIKVRYSFDGPKLLGTGGALRRALPTLDDVCWVLYGDSYLDLDYGSIWQNFQRKSVSGLMTVLRNDNRWDRSNVVFRDGQLIRYSKTETSPDMTHIDYGLALLRRDAIERLPTDEPSDLATLYSTLVAERRMMGHEVFHRFYEIGSHQGLTETAEYLRRKAA